jgi:hypothetical protein
VNIDFQVTEPQLTFFLRLVRLDGRVVDQPSGYSSNRIHGRVSIDQTRVHCRNQPAELIASHWSSVVQDDPD